jgi:cold shock protein
MINGTVKFYNQTKGFGFITPDDGGADVFVPAASLSASKVSSLKTGQRVRFEIEADKKGTKAANLLIDADKPQKEQPAPPAAIVHYDPSSEESATVLAALRGIGKNFLLQDYVGSPPSHDELQRLSVLLRSVNQSLVRRYHPLFMELQLDDRFIGESEFWTAIAEHPQLINGPILTLGNTARICKTEGEVRSFFGADCSPKQRPKAIPPRILAMINGSGLEPEAEIIVANASKEGAPTSTPTKPAARKKAQPETAKRPRKQALRPKKKSRMKATSKKTALSKKIGRKKRSR